MLTSILLCLGLAALTFFAFSPILDNNFILYDDPGYITENPHVLEGLSLDSIGWAFKATLTGNWIPLTWLSHMLDVELYGADPAGHHLTSLLFHICNVLLVFAFLQLTTRQPVAAALAAILFAVHPLRVESVAWASERKDVLSAFFGLLSLIAYVKYAEHKKPLAYVLAFLFLLLGLLSKAMLVTWPFLLLVVDFWPMKRLPSADTNRRRLLFEKIPFVLLVGAFSVIAFHAQRVEGAVHTLGVSPVHLRLANALVSYGRYLYKFVWPAELPLLYPLDISLFAPISLVGAAILLLAVTAMFFVLRKKRPYLLAGWLWFIGTLVPVIGLVQIGNQSIANRYMYLPSIGLCIIVAFAAASVWARSKGGRAVCIAVFACVIPALIFWTMVHCTVWKDSLSVFGYSLRVAPKNNYVMQFNLGTAFLKQNRYAEAVGAFGKAHQLHPASSEPIAMLGEAAVKQGEYEEAIAVLRRAVEMNVDLDEEAVYNNLGIAYAKTGWPQVAVEWFEKSLALAPGNAEILSNAASACRDSRQYEKAVAYLRKALELRPGFAPDLRKLADILLIENQPTYNPAEALRLARTACERTDYQNAESLAILKRAQAAVDQH